MRNIIDYVGKLAHGDLGESLRTRTSVWTEFTSLFPATLELSIAALIFAGILGLLAGVIAALKRGSLFDHGVMGISLAGYSMPIFWWGLILIMFFSVSLGWTPVSGTYRPALRHSPQNRFHADRHPAQPMKKARSSTPCII